MAVASPEGRFKPPPPAAAEFARVKEADVLDPELLKSNHASAGNLYLLDVPPGRYAPVSITWRRMGRARATRLTKAQSLMAAADVGPGKLAFGGRFRNLYWKVPKDTAALKSLVDRSTETERAALELALADLGGMLWLEPLRARLAELGPAGEPALLPPGIALEKAPGFSYRDTLGWGPPVKLNSGLEWREKLGRARIAAQYRKAGEPGSKGLGEELKFLKEAGSPEDDRPIRETITGGRPSFTARTTTYYYPPGYLLGGVVEAYVTETILIPGARGVWKLHYRAQKQFFDRFYPDFLRHARMIFFKED